MFELSFSQVSRLNSFFLLVSKVGPVVCVSFIWGEICAEFLFVFPLVGKAE